MTAERKAIWGWALYDWANSSFVTTVMAGFFPVFFKQYWSRGVDVNLSTAQLGLGNSLASLCLAVAAPILGAIADKGSARKRFTLTFAYIGAFLAAALFFVPQGQWAWAIVIYAGGAICFSGGNIFYDSLLPAVAPPGKVDYVSGLGYSLGYLGGGLLFLINVVMTLKPTLFGLADAGQAVRVSFLTVGAWWAGFSLFMVRWVPEVRLHQPLGPAEAVRQGFRQLARTFGKIKKMKPILIFLIAYWCYIDGVDTVIRMSVDYGMSLGLKSTDLITALLMVQFIGFPSALVFGWLGRRFGPRRPIFVAIGVYMAVTAFAMQMSSEAEFYILAAVVGLVQGGIQALSRSYYTRLIPVDQSAEFFGFYNMMGKFAVIFGPAMMGLTGLIAKRLLLPPGADQSLMSQVSLQATRLSIGSLLILFVIGAVMLYFVREDRLGGIND